MRKIVSIMMILIGLFFIGLSISMRIKSFNNEDSNGLKDVSRTIMIYVAGSDLESEKGIASADINSIDYKNLNEDVNVVMMLGGTEKWRLTAVNPSETSIFELNNRGISKVDKQSLKNMGDSETLKYFLNFVYENYKTDEYILMLYGHGFAVGGALIDDITKNDFLEVREIQDGIKDSPFKSKKLEMIIFRSCLNGTLEIANSVKDYARYLVASEEVSYGSSELPAFEFINDISRESTSISIGKSWIKNYMADMDVLNEAFSTYYNKNINVTYSMIDLSKIDPIVESLDKLSKDLNDNASTDIFEYFNIRNKMSQYAYDMPGYDMIDAYDFAEKYSKYNSEEAGKLKTSIEKAVIFNKSNNDYSHGLSLYFPYNQKVFLGFLYDKVSVSNNYKTFITEMVNKKNSYLAFVNASRGESDYLYKSGEEIKNAKDYYISVKREDKYDVIYHSENVYSNVNNTYAIFEGKLIKFNDEYVYAEELKTDKEQLYKIPMVLVKGEKRYDVYLIITVNEEHPTGYITSITSRTKSNNISIPSMIKYNIADYDKVELVKYEYNGSEMVEKYQEINLAEMKIETSNFEGDEYFIIFGLDNDTKYKEPLQIIK